MIAFMKNIFNQNLIISCESKPHYKSYLLSAFLGLLEDLLFWKSMWLSVFNIFFVNVLFFLFSYKQLNILQFVFGISTTIVCFDAIETWLRYKHRTTCLKRLAKHNGTELNKLFSHIKYFVAKKWNEYVFVRETNHTKAYLVINIILVSLFMVGKFINGYFLMYLVCLFICISHKVAPFINKLVKKIDFNVESDTELEGLIPEVSEVDIKLLSIEPENHVPEVQQSLDYWKPDDVLLEDCSDSSDNSSSLVTNISMEKMHSLDKDIETSDSSEDEYVPLDQQKDQLQSTLDIVQPSSSWGGAALSVLSNVTGAMTNMIYTKPEDPKSPRVPSGDSSDGFEIIDKNDLL